ncbi:pyridoxamine 5'-phosphate oxidase family protein [Microbacterium aquimaris]|uniref:Pyridoxamine 5'-phosphate oxidase family protein n=1 Tax=Microbacterium aquimaris TaxID=459816 RepID=A0ABU5N5P2_9MICO|nr:pyridoxamine 5'-phosphate oxidase family protein [Microbacterium aquimaris]MDZ8161395.1 pyridoxamine 5'-phosphate oxidase family protein [Microbacterium aquimaris]
MTTSTLHRLSTAECWTHLEAESVGRLAIVRDDGGPDLFPVNIAAHEGAVYFRTASDSKVVRLTAHPAAAFEVDGHDDHGWWSVVVRGHAERIADPTEIERSGVSRLLTASPRYKPHVFRLTPDAITGRRFEDRDVVRAPTHTSVVDAQSGDPADTTPDSPPHERYEAPQRIPSHRPY